MPRVTTLLSQSRLRLRTGNRVALLTLLSLFPAWQALSVAQPGPVTANVEQKEHFALLVGVDHYSIKAFDTLTAPGNDARSVRQLLIDKYAFPSDDDLPDPQKHIQLLIGAQATHAAIRDTFRSQLIDKAKRYRDTTGRNASVTFFFSGHGSRTANQQHRTIVPSDRGVNGVHDISDAELTSWLNDLTQYTEDVTLILDSCSSGARTKALQEHLIIREIPPEPASNVATLSADSPVIPKDLGNDFVSPNKALSSIYGCLRSEYCYETSYDTPNGTTGYGVLTYYLVSSLRANPHITYRELVAAVSRAIGPSISQHPQAEGNIGRPVFGSEGEYEDPYISIQDGPVTGRTLTIGAGRSLGVQVGSFIAIYRPEARHLQGDESRIAGGRVINASAFTATVELTEAPTSPIPASAKVVNVTPFFGAQLLRVNLEANLSGTPLSAADRELIAGVRSMLATSSLVSLVNTSTDRHGSADAAWDIGLQKGCLDKSDNPTPAPRNAAMNPCAVPLTSIFYLVTPSANSALYEFWVKTSATDGVKRIADLIKCRAQQENLRSLSNMASPYNNKVVVSIVKIREEKSPDGTVKGVPEPGDLGQDGVPRLKVGENFQVKIHNASTSPLDAALLVLGTSGKVMLLTPNGTGQLIDPRGDMVSDVYTVGVPHGLETYLVIAYTPPRLNETSPNFSLLEQSGATPDRIRNVSSDPLSWLINQAGVGRSRDPMPSALNVSSWAVARVDIFVE